MSEATSGDSVIPDIASLIRATNTLSYSRGAMRRSFAFRLPSKDEEGAGKTGCALHPRSRRRVAERYAANEYTGSAVNTPASLTQWLYGLYEIVLVTGFVATIALGQR
jgi:hypothetical protein